MTLLEIALSGVASVAIFAAYLGIHFLVDQHQNDKTPY